MRRVISDKESIEVVDRVATNYCGNVRELEHAIGALFVGRLYGWRVLMLMHDRTVFRKYERILGLDFQKIMPEDTRLSHRSLAYKVVTAGARFWDAVKGIVPKGRSPMLE